MGKQKARRSTDDGGTGPSRRDVLRYGAWVAGTAVVGPTLLSACSDGSSTSKSGSSTTLVEPGRPLEPPKAVASSNGELAVDLTAEPATVDLGVGRPVKTWTYGGSVPGDTWELQPGDTIKVHLDNALPPLKGAQSDSSDHPVDMTRPHQWANTNLHTHGLHVSPKGNSDNVFVDIEPGMSFDYEIAIPADHTGGLFWYHPHRHGAVCQQVRGGMAGALVVRGAIDEVPEVAAAREQIMVLQAIEVNSNYELAEPIPDPSKTQAFFPRDEIFYTVNGQTTPTVTMKPGEVQRWRLLNAAEGKFMSLSLEEHPFHVLAWDGLTLAAPEVTDTVMMAAANRVDLLVKADKPGKYDLVLTPGSSQHPLIPGMPGYEESEGAKPDSTNTTIVSNAELKERTMLTLIVEGDETDMDLPTELPAFDLPIKTIAKEREFEFTVERGPDAPPDGGESHAFLSFGVDGRPFSPDNPPYQATLGTAERWKLVNGKDAKLPLHAHSFHIHVNPFKVTAVNDVPLDPPQWRDTMVLPGNSGDSFTMEMNFEDFDGKFVEHCHVLSHEDLGMMEAIEVVDAEAEGNATGDDSAPPTS